MKLATESRRIADPRSGLGRQNYSGTFRGHGKTRADKGRPPGTGDGVTEGSVSQ